MYPTIKSGAVGLSGGHGGPRGGALQCRVHGIFRCAAGGNAVQKESLERRQRAAVERGGEGSAAGVGDLGVLKRTSSLSFASTPVGSGGAPAGGGGGGATRGLRGPRRQTGCP